MTLSVGAALLVAVFFTSMLSGIFGMAGGLVLLGVLLFMLPVGTAIAVQGVFGQTDPGALLSYVVFVSRICRLVW